MFCPKCGKKVEDSFNFCPNCQNRLNNNDEFKSVPEEALIIESKIEKSNLDKTTLSISIVSLMTAILPLSVYIVIFGSVIGLINLVIETFNILKSQTKKPLLVIVISITSIITNLGWYYFLQYVL